MADIDRRLPAALTTLMPPSRRAFGQALAVELGHTRRRDRVQLELAVFGAFLGSIFSAPATR